MSAVSGQFVAPLRAAPHIALHVETLHQPAVFPFPWPLLSFCDAFPELAHMKRPPLASLLRSGDEDFAPRMRLRPIIKVLLPPLAVRMPDRKETHRALTSITHRAQYLLQQRGA